MTLKARSRPAMIRQIDSLKFVLSKRLYQPEACYALGAQNALDWAIGRSSIKPIELFEFMRKTGAAKRRKDRAR